MEQLEEGSAFDGAVGLDGCCEIGFELVKFIRVFRRSFGTTPHRYVVHRRLEKAKAMLASERSLAGIAYALGFSSQAHFTATFRRHFDMTPGEARRSGRQART